MKSRSNSSKSTRAKSKNILAVKKQRLTEKIDYTLLYSDLFNSCQVSKKTYAKENNIDSVNDSCFEFEKLIKKKKIKFT